MMMMRFTWRMLREVDPRVLARFAWNFGWQGVRAVNRFQRRVQRGEYFPAFLFLSVTNRCNLACRGCWSTPTRPPQDLAPDVLDRIVAEARPHGCRFFGILGGEPLLHPGILDFMDRHRDCYFLLFTNGTLIDTAVARRLRALGNVSPLISIEGDPRVSDERRGGSDVWRRTMEGLARCREQRLIVGAATSVCRSNQDALASRAFLDELVRRGVHYAWYYIYRPVGPDPAPELALEADDIVRLRRFLVDARCEAPLLIVDAYWDHEGRALCPAATGIGHHISPAGYLEPCPPIQFAAEHIGDGSGLHDRIAHSAFLAAFRRMACGATCGCVLMDAPGVLHTFLRDQKATDSSGRGTGAAELAAMTCRPSHHLPGREIPERHPLYRFAKRHWFFGFGAYG